MQFTNTFALLLKFSLFKTKIIKVIVGIQQMKLKHISFFMGRKTSWRFCVLTRACLSAPSDGSILNRNNQNPLDSDHIAILLLLNPF